ncbi:MAG: carbohydrate binding domain-containing protein [Armatimonadetes bacterium]|nr:carbohydrate binding domain-containing protein [Armatimonadota bacterium]
MVSFALVLLLGAASAGSAQAERNGNLIPNGGFEKDGDRDGLPDGWAFADVGEGVRPEARPAAPARAGRSSLCVVTGGQQVTLTSPGFVLKPGATYQVSAWLRMEGRFPQDMVSVRVATDAGNRSFEFHLARPWRKCAATFVAPEGARSATLQFRGLGGLADRTYMDDVAVREAAASVAERKPPVHRTDLARFEFPRTGSFVEYATAQIEEMKREMAGRDSREHPWVRQAEPLLQEQFHFFKEGYTTDGRWLPVFNVGMNCPKDAARLNPVVHADGSHEMKCPKCEGVYRTEANLQCARAVYNQNLLRAGAALGRAYALTGDERYARRVKDIMLGLAERYPTWGRGPHLSFTTLNEAENMVSFSAAFEQIRDSVILSVEERRKIEEGLLRPVGEFIRRGSISDRMNNRAAIYSKAVMAIGLALRDKALVDHALNDPDAGLHALSAGMFDADGLSFEGFGYQSYGLSGLSPTAEMAYRIGLNVYRDPAYRKVFLPQLQILLPGEESRGWVRQYDLACRRFAEAGQPLEFPFDDEGRLTVVPASSYNFGKFGYGILRSGEGLDQVYLTMEYGVETMFMGHAPAPKFATLLYANRRLLTPRGATSSYGDPLCGGWSRRTLAHNALTVDDRDQWGRTPGRFVAFEAAPRVKVARAADDETYGGVTLDRTLFLADGYVVDLSAALAAAGDHRFDLCYRFYGDLACGLPFQPRGGPLGAGHGYQYLTDARSARTAADWSADWRQAEDSALRLSVVGGPETEVIACASPDNRSAEEKVDAIVARRWGGDTVFASVWETYRDRPSVVSTRRLPAAGGDAEGVGVEVVRQGRPGAECFLAAYAAGERQYGDIELDGKIAAGRWVNAEAAPDYAYLVKGVLLRRGGRSLEASAPATLYVEQIAPDRLRVQTGSESAGKLALTGRLAAGAGVTRAGEKVATKADRGRTLTFTAAADAAYEVTGVADWRRIRLAREGRAQETAAAEMVPVAATAPPEPTIQAPLAPDGTLAGKNKVPDAGFEVNPKSRPGAVSPWETWSSYHFAKFRPRTEYDAEQAHSGKHSLKILQSNWANEATQDGWIEQRVPGVGAGKTYTLSAWVKANLAPTRVRLCIYGYNPKWGNDYEGGVSPMFDVGTEWQRVAWTRTFGPEITDVRVMVKREHQVLGGDLWIDDVQLEEGPAATDFAPDAWSGSVQQ